MMSDAYTFLRKVPLFAELPDSDLEQVCQQVEEVRLLAGEVLFEEGSIGQQAYIIEEGQMEIFKNANGNNLQLAIRQSGEIIGEMALLESVPRIASGRALTDSLLLSISQDAFDHLLDTNPSSARTMLHTVTSRLRSSELLLSQSEKMAQLGTLTAGIAHELNNPASAVKRGAEQFKSTFAQYQEETAQLHRLGLSPTQFQALQDLTQGRQAPGQLPPLDPVERNDLESEFEEWLEERGVENSWEQAPLLVDLGYQPAQLTQTLAGFPASTLPDVIGWLTHTIDLYSMLDEMSQGASRISEIIRALKSYVYLDQAPLQTISVHEGLENTLVILRHKLKQGVEIQREYDPAVPPIQAYGSELNQVWTNIIDNAIDAMDGQGKIKIHTAYKDPWVVVDIADSGPGIPLEIQSKVFNPFFTTKPFGKGTGLGLSITYNIIHKHGGDVKVISHPGDTHFEVWLPLDIKKAKDAGSTFEPIHRGDDDSLRKILQSSHTVAVVGISDRPDRPAHTVPAYLKSQGFRIFPVNPGLDQVLGEPAYPDLLSVPEPVDIVLIFRASEFVPEIVDQAIAIHAKVVWMQEGIVNEAAAQKASQAGLEVVVDTCIRVTHKRLFLSK
jgi:signal transduction histidine kinase/predicted CoA-binding protein